MADILKQRLIGALLLLSVIIAAAAYLVSNANQGSNEVVEVIENDFVSSIETSPIEFTEIDQETLVDPHQLEKVEILSEPEKVSAAVEKSQPEIANPKPVPVIVAKADLLNKESDLSAKMKPASKQWLIQLASFSKQENAKALQDRVTLLGYTSKIEPITQGATTNYRVRIGPESDRKKVDETVTKLAMELKLKPQVLTIQAVNEN